jgi:hypothetical protein
MLIAARDARIEPRARKKRRPPKQAFSFDVSFVVRVFAVSHEGLARAAP